MREEVLEEKLTDILRMLRFDEEVDKLDGKIGERFCEQKSAETREDQKVSCSEWRSTRTLHSPI